MIDLGVLTLQELVPIGILAVLGLGVAFLYSIKIALSLLRSYWAASSPRSGGIAIGLLLLTTVPIAIRFGLGTVSGVSATHISLFALSVEIIGIGVILTSLYVPGGERP